MYKKIDIWSINFPERVPADPAAELGVVVSVAVVVHVCVGEGVAGGVICADGW